MIRSALITPPAGYPVSLAEAKTHLAIPLSETDHDDLISGLIGAATEVCENITNRKFITQTVEVYYDSFPGTRYLELPFGKLQSVTSLSYVDENGGSQTFSSTKYQADGAGILGVIQLNEYEEWPDIADEVLRAVTVRYVCGFGAAADVPKSIKQAILCYVGTLYENRESIISGTIVAKTPDTVELLLASNRIYYFQ